jgi:hypothetical protein
VENNTNVDGQDGQFVLKTCPLNPISVARIKREIKILSDLDSRYFPKLYFQFFITDEVLGYYIDSFDPKTTSGTRSCIDSDESPPLSSDS